MGNPIRVKNIEELRRITSFDPEDGDNDNPNIVIEGNDKAAEQIDLADGEKLILFEGFCRRCDTTTVMVYSSLTRRYLCTGCGRRMPAQNLAGRLWDRVANLIQGRNGGKNPPKGS